MSRIGRLPIQVPTGVSVKIDSDNTVTVKGPNGTLTQTMHPEMTIEQENDTIIVKRSSDNKKYKALHGLTRSLLNNMVTGVKDGFSKKLEINGVGYRAQKQGKKLVLTLGYSHPIEMEEPAGITYEVPDASTVIVKGIDKQLVGEMAAKIRFKRPPEPYKGKGVKYADETILRKEGKSGSV